MHFLRAAPLLWALLLCILIRIDISLESTLYRVFTDTLFKHLEFTELGFVWQSLFDLLCNPLGDFLSRFPLSIVYNMPVHTNLLCCQPRIRFANHPETFYQHKAKLVFRKWPPRTNTSLRSPQRIQTTCLHSSTMLRGDQWCDLVVTTFQNLVWSFQLVYCRCFFHVSPADFTQFNGFLNCFIDSKNITNYLIPRDIDYTQACTTPISKIRHQE